MKLKITAIILASVVCLTQAKAGNMLWSQDNDRSMNIIGVKIKFSGEPEVTLDRNNRLLLNKTRDDFQYSILFRNGEHLNGSGMATVSGFSLIKFTGDNKEDAKLILETL